MSNIDLALIQDANGQFDIGIDPDTGDFLLTDGFDTALVMSLFCERRADESEVPTAELRRGWWGNTVGPEGFEIGSKLWLLDQSRKIQATLNRAEDYTREALQWFIDDGHLVSFDVSAIFSSNGITLNIKLNRSNSATESRSYQIWENTEAFGNV
jgi:phage gp46-like protein